MRDRNQVVMPINVGILIGENEPVRKLVEICDELDYSKLYETFLRHWRKVNPRTLFEIIVFAYMCGIYASREIEAACRHDIRFMWILNGEPVPDHSTIARFQNERLTGVMEKLFYQLIEKLYEISEMLEELRLDDSQSCVRLKNGNTILCSRGHGGRPQCTEITKDGEIVWVLRDFRWLKECTAVQILDDPGDPEIVCDCER